MTADLARLDELTAIAQAFEATLLRHGGQRAGELVRDHTRVMQARSGEIDRLRREGLPTAAIAAHLDAAEGRG